MDFEHIYVLEINFRVALSGQSRNFAGFLRTEECFRDM